MVRDLRAEQRPAPETTDHLSLTDYAARTQP
jgi:hypothetical protein